MVLFKICGLTRPEDAFAAEKAGASYGGVILGRGSPRTITVARAAEVLDGTSFRRVGVFVNQSGDEISSAVRDLALSVVQLHGDETPEFARTVGSNLDVRVWKAVRPRNGEEFVRMVDAFSSTVDGIHVDGWSAHGRGGTGTPFPWIEVAAYRKNVPASRDLIVAGGLNPSNVAEVIAMLDPGVVDVSSGVESSPGVKNPDSIRAFAEAVGSATVHGGRP